MQTIHERSHCKFEVQYFLPQKSTYTKVPVQASSPAFLSMAWACKHHDAGAAGWHVMKYASEFLQHK